MAGADGRLVFQRAREHVTERLPQEIQALRRMVQARGLPLDGPMDSIIRAIRKEHALTDAECAALEKNRLFVHGPWYIWACEMSPREQGAVALDDHVVDACLIVLLLKCIHDTPGGFCALLRDDRNKVLYGPMIETMLSCAHATDAEKARIRRDYAELDLRALPRDVLLAVFKRHGMC